MFCGEMTPQELEDLAAALGTSHAAVRRRSQYMCAQQTRLFEAWKPGLQGFVSLLTGQAREKRENDIRLVKAALRDWPLWLVAIPSYSTRIEHVAPGIQQHAEWGDFCQSVREIGTAVRNRHERIMANSSFELH